jgi:hypothetical protein
MNAAKHTLLPPLVEPTMDPQRRCAVCGDSGWEPGYELITWRRFGSIRERISAEAAAAIASVTEGFPHREVYPVSWPCRCSAGSVFREAYRQSNGGAVEPVPTKPVKREKGEIRDGKARASGE